MNPKLIAANAAVLILILTLAPQPVDIYLAMCLYAANSARYFYRKGGRWGDDYERTTVKPGFWQRQDAREKQAEYCMAYRASIILGVILLGCAVVL